MGTVGQVWDWKKLLIAFATLDSQDDAFKYLVVERFYARQSQRRTRSDGTILQS